jgi:hypothetical protein
MARQAKMPAFSRLSQLSKSPFRGDTWVTSELFRMSFSSGYQMSPNKMLFDQTCEALNFALACSAATRLRSANPSEGDFAFPVF